MDELQMPELVEIRALAVPDRFEFVVGRSRHLLVSITVLPAEVTLHAIEAVGRSFDSPEFVQFRVRDERGVEYPLRSGGGASGVSGSPCHLLQHFARPDQHDPQQLTLTWESQGGPRGPETGDIGTFVIESRRM
ncbi:hypothetical protein [Gordonia sihwensis]|uniref:hypothetical protein n=1 Tax=Gordonia sihwensis TaxID=173559 RepID=UPI00241634FB|nr:hypothetical protein [Gordonia sihwensis]WFN94132.1 hypothetical protein P5P27_06190 [Gordonia sihwensis]WFN94193.1 hypothetical protein P5P27_06500 [Gordonia sihwensis]